MMKWKQQHFFITQIMQSENFTSSACDEEIPLYTYLIGTSHCENICCSKHKNLVQSLQNHSNLLLDLQLLFKQLNETYLIFHQNIFSALWIKKTTMTRKLISFFCKT